MKRTYRDYYSFKMQGTEYVKEKGDTRYSYAVKKALKRNESVNESHVEEYQDLQVENALTDDKSKKVLRDLKGNPEHDKEKNKLFRKQAKELMDKVVDIKTPDTDVEGNIKWPTPPDDLTIDEIEMFSGFVINPDLVEEMVEKVLQKSDKKEDKK